MRDSWLMDKVLRYAPILLISYSIIIIWLSLSPSSLYSQYNIKIPHVDKLVHAGMYLFFSSLLFFTLKKFNRPIGFVIFSTILVSYFFGLVMETLQFLIPYLNRSFEWGDTLSNLSGTVGGTLIAYSLRKN